MPQLPELPSYLGLLGPWAVSVHRFSGTEGPLEVVLASKEVDARHFIKLLEVLPARSLDLQRLSGSYPIVTLKDSDWAKPFIEKSEGVIGPQEVYAMFNKQTARRLLTGHLLALRFYPLLRMKEIVSKPDLAGLWDKEFKFYNNNDGITITQYTAINYRILTDWLETAPSQVLAAIEGVSPTTIRNRLHSAREAGLIGKPGPGKRSTRSNGKEVNSK